MEEAKLILRTKEYSLIIVRGFSRSLVLWTALISQVTAILMLEKVLKEVGKLALGEKKL